MHLQDVALAGTTGSLGLGKSSTNSLIEDVLKTLLGKSGTLHVTTSVDLTNTVLSLLLSNNSKTLSSELLNHVSIAAKIGLGTDKDEGNSRSVVLNLRVPLGLDVVERIGRDNGETNEEDVSLGVRKRAKTIVILLTSGIY